MRAGLLYLLAAFAAASAQNYGVISDFRVLSISIDTIELEWTISDADVGVSKYTLITDGDFAQDVRCPVSHCTHVVDYLDACTIYNFELTAHYDDGVDSEVVTTSGSTVEQVPGAPVSPSATSSSNGILVTWEKPTENANCVDRYLVCARIIGQADSKCQETQDNTLLIEEIQLCSDYVLEVYAVTPMGQYGSATSTSVLTQEGVPGMPRNVVVTLSTPTLITITYDDPLENPRCIDEFGVIYGEVTEFVRRVNPSLTGSHEHTISPLDACTNYTIGVYGVSPSGKIGPTATRYAATADTQPISPPLVIVDPTGPDSIDVIWDGNPEDKCSDTIVICWTDHIHPEEICQEIDGGGSVDGGGTFTITDLLPCSNYEVIITIDSPSGISSLPVTNWTFTEDIKPNPVENLKVKSIDTNTVIITYDPPSEQEQCVKEYDTRVINLDEGTLLEETLREKNLRIEESHNQLEACTNYGLHIRTVTRTGLKSEWNIVEDKTAEATPTEARNLQQKDGTDTSIDLLWFQPLTNKRCAIQYRLEWEAAGSDSLSTLIDLDPNNLPFEVQRTLTDLQPCTDYLVTVTAISASTGESSPTTLNASTGGCPL